MRNPTPSSRCHSCGSLVFFQAKPFRDQIELSWRCPGCRYGGGTYHKDLSLEEAEYLAQQQNALAATPEAAAEAERWKERSAGWVASDAAVFLDLLQARFPEWREHLTYQPDDYLGGAHRLTIPSSNPQVDTPLTLGIAINEVLIGWVSGWHVHVWRDRDTGQKDKTHLSQALSEIEDLVEERIVTGICYVDGQLSCSGNLRPDEGIPAEWKDREARWNGEKPTTIVARSWRGTYDEEWRSASPR
jgi:hypothetical protein